MSCRWSCHGRFGATLDRLAGSSPGSLSVLRELARSRRKGDFLWLALSEGVAAEDVSGLWDSLRAQEGADPPD